MADNLNLALKIKADLNNAVTNFKTLINELQRTTTATNQLSQKSTQSAKGLDNLAASADNATGKIGKTRAGVESISKQLARLETLGGIGLFGSAFAGGVRGLAQTADEFNSYEARVRLVSRSNQHAESTFKALMQTANDTGQLFGATAELYTRVYRAMGAQANSNELLQFTKTINQSMVVSGAGAQEASAAIIQLSQGMAAGALRGEEFNSVAEQAPIILEVLQKHLGKTRGELRKMAEEGKLTTGVILAAVNGSADEIQAQYDNMPKTIGRAVNELSNAWMQFIGQTDNAVSASAVVAGTISMLAEHLDLLAGVALTVATIFGVRMVSAYGAQLVMMAKLATMSLVANQTMTARAVIEIKLAQAALAAAKSTDAEAAAVARLAAANKALDVARAGAAAKAGIGSGLTALLGGPIGVAVTAVMGLIAVYSYLKSKEEELEAQYQQTVSSLEDNIDKTEALIEARNKLAESGRFSDRLAQIETNNQTMEAAKQQLEELRQKYKELETVARYTGDFTPLTAQREKIAELEAQIQSLSRATDELSSYTRDQLTNAFNAAIAAGGDLADKLQAIGDANAPEAVKLLTPVIKDAEIQIGELNNTLKQTETRLRKELADATLTAEQRLASLGVQFDRLAKQAGFSSAQVAEFSAQLVAIQALQKQVADAKQSKDGQSYLEGLRKRAATAGQGTADRIRYDNRDKGLSGEDLAEADKLAAQIEISEKRRRGGSRGGSSRSKKDQAAENEQKNLELNIQYLRLTGQEVKANLTDVESRYNRMIAEFQKAGNVDGINLIKKILPLEQAKVQIDGVQTEINKLYQNLSAQEQKINAQVQTGLISHLEGQRQLKDVYTQTIEEIEKQLPLLERLAKMPGAQGEQARVMMEQMKLKITELKSAGNDLEKAFKDGLTQGIQSSLMGLVQGTMSLKDAIKNLALTVVNSMAQIAAQQLAMQAVSSMSSWWGAAGSAVGGAVMAASGGYIRGPGTSTSDSIPAKLSDGEFVVNAAMVRRYGVDFLHSINRGQLRRFSQGGLVSAPDLPVYREPGLTREMREGTNGQQAPPQVNIRQTLAVDSAELFTSGINTVAGERAVLTVIRANKDTLKQELS